MQTAAAPQKREPQKKPQGSDSIVEEKQAVESEEVLKSAGTPLFLQRYAASALPPPVVPRAEEDEDQDRPGVFPRLATGAPDDDYEREADQVSNAVLRAPASGNSRITALGNDSAQTKPIQLLKAQNESGDKTSSQKVLRIIQSPSGGSSLPGHVRSRIEPVLGDDLSCVKVHSDAQANQAAHSIEAKAFTHNNHIYLGEGQSPNDLSLMAHETAHVIQQGAGGMSGRATPANVAQNVIQRFPLGESNMRELEPSRTFSYLPERGLDIVWPLNPGDISAVAEEIYGNSNLASELEEVFIDGQTGYRFQPTLLTPDWRLVYFEQRARREHPLQEFALPDISLSTSSLAATPEIVVIFLRSRGQAPFNFGLNPERESQQPVIRQNDFRPSIAMGPAASAGESSFNMFDLPADVTSHYTPQTDYGEPVGELSQIVESPENYRNVLDREDQEIVTVRIDPRGDFGHLASRRSWYQEEQNRSPFENLGFQSGFRLGPQGVSFESGFPIIAPSGGLIVEEPINLSGLDRALSMRQEGQDEWSELGSGAQLILPAQDSIVMVLDIEGQPALRMQDRFIIIGGPQAQDIALQNRQGATYYTWDGAQLSQTGIAESDIALPVISPDLLRRPTVGLTLGGGDLDYFSYTGREQNVYDLFTGFHNPLMRDVQVIYPPETVYVQIITIGEIRALVRRYSVQSMLEGARDEERRRLGLDDNLLINLVTPERYVHGTEFDCETIVQTGNSDAMEAVLERATPVLENASLPDTLDMFDAALLQLDSIIRRHGRYRDLFTALRLRLIHFQDQLMTDHSQLTSYAGMIQRQINIASNASRAIVLLPQLLTRYRDSYTVTRELEDIRDLYALALAFSDQSQTAETLYQAAEMRMVMFPFFVVHLSGEEMNTQMRDIFADTGDDSVLMSLDVTEEREQMRATSEEPQQSDLEQLRQLVEEGRAANRSGDRRQGAELAYEAAEIVDRMNDRFRILAQLHQALVAFQQMGNSSAAFTQCLADNDEKLENLVVNLQNLLAEYEDAESDEERAEVMGRVAALWESEDAYRRFYEEIYDFINFSDFLVRVGIMVAAGLLTWGVGSAAVSAGFVAEGSLGLLALESAVFTGANMAGERALFDRDPNEGLSGYEHPEEETAGGLLWEAGTQFALNMATFGAAKYIGRLGRMLGGRVGLPHAGEMAAVFSLFEGIGTAQFVMNERRLPEFGEFLQITGQNAIMLGAMHTAGLLSRPLFERMQLRLAYRFGNYEVQMRFLESRRMSMAQEMRDLMERTSQSGETDNAAFGELSARAEQLASEANRLQVEMTADPRIRMMAATDPAMQAALESTAARLEAHTNAMSEVLFSARAGLRAQGDVWMFNRGMAQDVTQYYRERGYDVSPTVENELSVLRVTRRSTGESITLRESRTATAGSGFNEAYERAASERTMAGSGRDETIIASRTGAESTPPAAEPGTPEFFRQQHEAWMEVAMRTSLEPGSPLNLPPEAEPLREAYCRYEEALSLAPESESAIFRNRTDGAYLVRTGGELSVSVPEGYDTVLHYHPNPNNVLILRMPAPADIQGTMFDVIAAGRPITEFVEYPLPEGGRSRVAFTVTPDPLRITTEYMRPDGTRVLNTYESLENYSNEWSARTTYLDPESPAYEWVMRDLDANYAGRESGFGRTALGLEAPLELATERPECSEALEPHPVDLSGEPVSLPEPLDVGTYGRTGMEFHLYTTSEVAFGMRTNFDPVTRLPRSVEYMQVAPVNETLPARPSRFGISEMIPSEYQLRHQDYTGTEFERGHLMPREAAASYPDALEDIDVMSNIAPMRGRGSTGINQGIWRSYERLAGEQAAEYGWIRVVVEVVTLPGSGVSGALPEVTGFTRTHYAPNGEVIMGVSIPNH